MYKKNFMVNSTDYVNSFRCNATNVLGPPTTHLPVDCLFLFGVLLKAQNISSKCSPVYLVTSYIE